MRNGGDAAYNAAMSTVLLLLPDFSLIVLGCVLRRTQQFGDAFWSGIERLVYFILFPALLVNAIAKTRLELASAAPLIAAALSAMGVGMLLALPLRRLFRLPPLLFASVFQCAYRFNTYIGLGAAGLLFGTEGIAALGLVVGAAVPLANLVAVWMLARHGRAGVLREIARNPLIWATVTGLALNLFGWELPAPLSTLLGRLADAAVALGLLTVGAALRFAHRPGVLGASLILLLIKLVALPLAAWAIGLLVGLDGLYLQVVVLFAALPTASSAYILAVRMGGDGEAVAWLISASTVLSMFSMPLWGVGLAAVAG